jgi:hypothetical protein
MAHPLRSLVVWVKGKLSTNVRYTKLQKTTLVDLEWGNVECIYIRAYIGDNNMGIILVGGGTTIDLVIVNVFHANNIPMVLVLNVRIRGLMIEYPP